MIKLVLLFLSTGIALIVAVALIAGIAWLAVAVPVLIATAAGYGVLSLRRRAWRGKEEAVAATGRPSPPVRSGC
jgi:uncharacterized membrane protein YdbT with pleckstrin-like domain